jgi:hypothetical protein
MAAVAAGIARQGERRHARAAARHGRDRLTLALAARIRDELVALLLVLPVGLTSRGPVRLGLVWARGDNRTLAVADGAADEHAF